MLAAADAVFDAERALRRAAETVNELSDVASSSLRVLDDAASDAFYAHQEERRDFYLESAGEHLGRLRSRSGVMNELGEDLTRHLTAANSAIERAGCELGRGTDPWMSAISRCGLCGLRSTSLARSWRSRGRWRIKSPATCSMRPSRRWRPMR